MRLLSKLTIVATLIATSSLAQVNDNPLEYPFAVQHTRNEIVIPKIKGLNVYKADFHLHTIFSDGDVTPDMRVIEAWRNGLDIIAITDHMEYRRTERHMYRYMKDYIREDLRGLPNAVNTNVLSKDPDSFGLLVDFNISHELAVKKAKDYGIHVVRGVEITRKQLGDYNALFTTDNNKIYDPNLEQTIRNARAQGAFIIHNHPMRDKKSENTITPFTNDLYAKGLIDGVEIFNGRSKWQHLFSHCINGGYTPFSNSDAHDYIYWKYEAPASAGGAIRYRNMTLVLAKKLDDKHIHDALKKGNTIAYSNNNIVGKCELLQELFKESVEFEVQHSGAKKHNVTVINRSSLPYYFQIGKNKYILNGMGSLYLQRPTKENEVKVTVLNMWSGNDEHPTVMVKLK